MKVTGNGAIRRVIYHFLLVVWSNISCTIFQTLPHLRCMRPWDILQFRHNSWTFRLTTLFNSYVNISQWIFYDLWDSRRRWTAKVPFKVTQGHWYWCHLIGHTWFHFLVVFQCNYVSILHCFWDIARYWLKITDLLTYSTCIWHHRLG